MGITKSLILAFVAQNPNVTLAEVGQAVGVSNNAVWRHVSDLRNSGHIAPIARCQKRTLRLASSPEIDQVVQEATTVQRLCEASERCDQLVKQLREATSIVGLSAIYDGLVELSDLLAGERRSDDEQH